MSKFYLNKNTYLYNMLNKNTLGIKKYDVSQKQQCKQIGATNSFDISWGQEVTLSKIFLSPWMTYNSL